MLLSWMFVILLRFTAGFLFWLFTFGVIGIIAYGRYHPLKITEYQNNLFLFSPHYQSPESIFLAVSLIIPLPKLLNWEKLLNFAYIISIISSLSWKKKVLSESSTVFLYQPLVSCLMGIKKEVKKIPFKLMKTISDNFFESFNFSVWSKARSAL